AGDERRAREAMFDAVNRPQTERGMGVVHLVGAGPGDPDLLTLKALRLLQAADVIVYDRLVSPEILSLARRDALRIYVGKAKAAHAVPQKEIEQRLVHHARKGKTVIRLKGGDPFIFGRGGEELSALRRAGVPVFVTPGVTAAIGCAAAAGMALTHRGLSQAITFVTGHAKDDGEPDINWKALAALGHTIVVYMGVGKAGAISRAMLENGASPATPVAVVEKGTTAQQKILKGRLEELERLIEAGGVEGPAVLVIGEVAQMASGAVLLELAASERRAA
ncbi:MAG: uroporphyrinogen-III C-methyltransferase, partial [Parvularculaceae bacterium]